MLYFIGYLHRILTFEFLGILACAQEKLQPFARWQMVAAFSTRSKDQPNNIFISFIVNLSLVELNIEIV